MARKTSSLFGFIALASLHLGLTACEDQSTSPSGSTDILLHVNVLGVVNSALGDVEGDSSVATVSSTSCAKVNNCGTSKTVDATYTNCTDAEGATLGGATSLSFASAVECAKNINAANYTAGITITKTYNNFSKSRGGETILMPSGTVSAFYVSLSGFLGTLSMASVRRSAAGAFDYTMNTAGSPLVFNGRLTSGTRSISSGTLTVTDSYNAYTAQVVFSNVNWDAGCTYPISGTIVTTYSSGRTGSDTLTFTSTCGAATYTDTASATSNLTLTGSLD
jgi:hypothetical protein